MRSRQARSLVIVGLVVMAVTVVALLMSQSQPVSPTIHTSQVSVNQNSTSITTNQTENTTIIQDNDTTNIEDNDTVLTDIEINNAVQNLFILTQVAATVQVNITVNFPPTTEPPPTPIPSIVGYWQYGFSNYLDIQANGYAEFPSLMSRFSGTYTFDGSTLTIYGYNSRGESSTLQFYIMHLDANTLVVRNVVTEVVTTYQRAY